MMERSSGHRFQEVHDNDGLYMNGTLGLCLWMFMARSRISLFGSYQLTNETVSYKKT
jgi:hypothetical protein